MSRKGKEVDAAPSQRRNDRESPESSPNRAQKRKRTTKKKGKKVAKGKKPVKKRMTPAQIASAMRKMQFTPTKWADLDLLEKMGIMEEVNTIFQGMRLGGILNMAYPSHEEETIQFISSLRYEEDTTLDEWDLNREKIHFKVHGKEYTLLIAQLAALYNLPTGGVHANLPLNEEESLEVWADIAQGTFEKGRSKSSVIRHPALRYAHIILAHTLYARKEKGHVKEEELAWLIEGIKGSLVTTTNGRAIIGTGQNVNYGRFLALRLVEFRESIERNEDKSPSYHFGGLITPILNAFEINITKPESAPIQRIGKKELVTNHFLAGTIGERFAYRFKNGSTTSTMPLPNQATTTLIPRENILFHPGAQHLYDAARHGPILGSRAPRRGGPNPNQPHEDEGPVSGSSRYKFEPYDGVVTGEALRVAHKNLNALNRFVLWQNKNMKKAYKIMKKQGEEIKRLKSMCFSLRRSSNQESSIHDPWMARTSQEAEPSEQVQVSSGSSGSGNPSYSLGSTSNEE